MATWFYFIFGTIGWWSHNQFCDFALNLSNMSFFRTLCVFAVISQRRICWFCSYSVCSIQLQWGLMHVNYNLTLFQIIAFVLFLSYILYVCSDIWKMNERNLFIEAYTEYYWLCTKICQLYISFHNLFLQYTTYLNFIHIW